MWALGPLGFAAPALLSALVLLPVIWLILRAVPPSPVRRRFPAVALLLGLTDQDAVAARTPWWLLALRMAGLAALIIGFAGPVLNPRPVEGSRAPLLIVLEGGWSQAADWPAVSARMSRALDDAARDARPVALLHLADPSASTPDFAEAARLRETLPGLLPRPWVPKATAPALPQGRFDALWLAAGLDFEGRAALSDAVSQRGQLRVVPPLRPVVGLRPATLENSAIRIEALRSGDTPAALTVRAIGPDPSGAERELARAQADFAMGDDIALAPFDLPAELRNRVSRFDIEGYASAGAIVLGDDSLRRRKIALAGEVSAEGQLLLSPLHYLRQALEPQADLVAGTIEDLLPARPDVMILADIAHPSEPDRLAEWVEDGGLLIRFAGPRMAASADPARNDPLIPVRLRAGDRALGGALSWGAPRRIAPFGEQSPFAGLTPPSETVIRAQLMAEPAPELAEHTLAALEDGTPLVTASELGEGLVVLFHVTANADWSNLPLSGLFPQMLRRLTTMAAGAGLAEQELAGASWQPVALMDGFGRLSEAPEAEPLTGAVLENARRTGADASAPPGLYRAGERIAALNVLAGDARLSPANWPASVLEQPDQAVAAKNLGAPLLALGLVLLSLDVLASLAVSGRLARLGVVAGAILLMSLPGQVKAEDLPATAPAALVATLAHVRTGDPAVDEATAAGMKGLSEVLTARSTLEPGPPMMVDLEQDDLSLLTMLYWPVTVSQPLPSAAAYARLNRFLAGGGMIVFDTRDGDLAGLGAASDTAASLRALAAPLDIPPLEPMPDDHVLTRSFYLLSDLPGRYQGVPVWVEARSETGTTEGAVNDGVTPVIIGGADWAAAWATDERGLPLNAVGRGFAGERQREMAYRFGVNLMMHVMTGNYKADQVHVAEILERLGQ